MSRSASGYYHEIGLKIIVSPTSCPLSLLSGSAIVPSMKVFLCYNNFFYTQTVSRRGSSDVAKFMQERKKTIEKSRYLLKLVKEELSFVILSRMYKFVTGFVYYHTFQYRQNTNYLRPIILGNFCW